MSLLDTLKNWWDADSRKFAYFALPEHQADYRQDYQRLTSKKHYVRVWLTEMFLQKHTRFGTTYFPAVHSLVKFEFGSEIVQIPNVADGTKVGIIGDRKGDLIARNFLLTPLIPFNGGVIEINGGLAAIEGQNYVQSFIKVLGDFSTLLAAPQLSAGLAIAGPLASGVQSLFSAGGSHLSFHEAFEGGISGGYFVFIRAPAAEVDGARFWILDNTLREGKSAEQSEPFEKHDHLVVRLQILENRDDWDRLTFITEPMSKATQALKDGREEEAKSHLRAAIVAVHEARELTVADRVRAKLKLHEDFEALRKDLGYHGLVSSAGFNFARSMRFALSPDEALERRDPSFEELFGA
jgi:hypothetical protein